VFNDEYTVTRKLSVSLLRFQALKVKQLTDLTYYYHNQVVPHIQLVKAYGYLVG
jgi:hypothetical protein